MSTESKSNPDNIVPFVFESIILQSDRTDITIDLRNVVTDIELYETLSKPYITGKMVIVDNDNLLTRMDIQGGEKILIEIKTTRPQSQKIIKTFYIEHIMFIEKTNSNTEVIGLRLLEDTMFISNLQNISRYYTGLPTDICKKIANEYLGKKFAFTSSVDKPIKVIIPNKNPIHAIEWLKSRMATELGYPYYFFSSLVTDTLLFTDLGSLINRPSMNPNKPYHFTPATFNAEIDNKTIKKHRFEVSHDLTSLIARGAIGSEVEYIDTLTNKKNNFKFDVIEDVIRPVSNELPRKQRNMMISQEYKVDNKSLNKFQNTKITVIGGSNAFKNSDNDNVISYNESKTLSEYKINAKAHALSSLLDKTPLTITVDGIEFLQGDGHFTIGNNLSIQFLNSFTNVDPSVDIIDRNKSGDYLIYSTKHMFKREKYDLTLTGVKLANMDKR